MKDLQGYFCPPTVKQHLAAIRMLFDWLVTGHIIDVNPAHAVRSPKYVVKKGNRLPSSNLPILRNMAEKSYYIEFTFAPKQETDIRREAVVEVPKDLVRRKQTELINEDRREKAVALDLARVVALAAFSTTAERVAWPYDEYALWYDDRPSPMDQRACDHEENGVRVWRIT